MSKIHYQLIGCLFVAFAGHAAPPASCGTLNAGLQILTNIPSPAGGSSYSGALKMAIWYPTTATVSTYKYSGPGNAISGLVALNAPIASCAQFPLIVFSHGWSGCGTQSVFLTEQLARLGYIVAAPDHNDHGCSVDGTSESLAAVNFAFPFTQFGDPGSWTDQTGAYRNVDIETVLNYMLNTWTYKASINPDLIAMSGHSFGGYTTFGKIGGWNSWLNKKFKVAVMYSPFIQAFMLQNPSAMRQANVPQMFMTGGAADADIMPWIRGPQPCQGPCQAQPGAFEQAQSYKYYGELPGTGVEASHFAFSNAVCTNAGASTVQSCLAGVPNAQMITNYTLDFYDHFLGGQAPVKLWSTGSEWLTYWRTAGVPTGSYQPGATAATQELVTIFGEQLTSDPATAASGALAMPQSIGRTTVTITDSLGNQRSAPLYYVSPAQTNLVIPSGTATGQAIVAVSVAGSPTASGPITIGTVSPSVLPTSAGTVAGWAQNSGGYLNIWDQSGPMALSVTDGGTYVVVLGTGIRGAANVTATVGSVAFDGVHGPRPIVAASPQFQALDQVAIGPLPASLTGVGLVNVTITAAGRASNTVTLLIQ